MILLLSCYRFKWRQLLLAFSFFGMALLPARAELAHEIKDPFYGDTLFQFYQNRYFSSLTNLMVSQYFNRVEHHSEEAEMLRGGILLSYGLHREAGAIFTRLIDMGASPATRDRAWFYLAKIRYQRGYYTEAETAINNIGNMLPADLQEERGLLQSNLLMARLDYTNAITVLGAMDRQNPGDRYVRYNLGIAMAKSGDAVHGNAILDQLGQNPAEDEEYRHLRDRANLALGFTALATNQPEQARLYLERVRLKSADANKALLGLGWAADALKKPDLALIPWLELARREMNETAVLEAKIAVPYAYAELGSLGKSAQLYSEAITEFNHENQRLSTSIEAIQHGKLIDALIEANPGEEMGWLRNIGDLPDVPRAAHLAPILAQHEFQEAFKNYRDLQFLLANLTEWRDKLTIFEDMLENRRKAFADKLPQVIQQARQAGLESLQKRQMQSQQDVTNAEDEADWLAFADAKQTDLLARVSRSEAIIKDHAEPEIEKDSEKVRLAKGILLWQLSQEYPDRLWKVKKHLQEIQQGIESVEQLETALAKAQQDEPAHFDAFAQRINAVSITLNDLLPRVAALSEEQRHAVEQIAIGELERQQEIIGEYVIQARFALAQLYDKGTEKTNDSHSEKAEVNNATTP